MATTGEWGGLQIRFDIPEITDAVTVIESVFEIVIVALDIALSVLSVIKSFVTSLLNPVRAIIQELIAALQNLLLDFRQAGFYTNGDWTLLSDTTLEQLKGGYEAYQTRMVTRLTDRSDLGRPNFTPSTTVLALFLYTGADISFIDNLADFSGPISKIHQLIEGFAGFFGINIDGATLPVPSELQANFTNGASRVSTSSVVDFRSAVSRIAGRTSAVLQWRLAPSPGSDNTRPTPVVPPDGFLVEISVWPKGLYAGYLAPVPGSTGGVAGTPAAGGTTPSSYSTGMYQEGDTGKPLQIFGGLDSVLIGDEIQWSASFEADGSLKIGARPAFFLTDLTSTKLIKTNVLKAPSSDHTGRIYNQRTLYVPHSSVLMQSLIGGVYSLELSKEDFPWETPILADGTPDFANAIQASTVYVRVLSCSDKITGSDSFKWDLVPVRAPDTVQIKPVRSLETSARSTPSQPIKVTFPSEESDGYLQALQTALAVLVLSRADIILPSASLNAGSPPISTRSFTPTGLETFAQNILPFFAGDIQDFFTHADQPGSFGSDITSKIVTLADTIIERQGNLPQNVLASLATKINRLNSWRWSDTTVAGASGKSDLNMTILDSLSVYAGESGTGTIPTMYVAKNASSLKGYPTAPVDSKQLCQRLEVIVTYPNSGFGDGIEGMPDVRFFSPIIVDIGDQTFNLPKGAWYARNLITAEIYADCKQMLSLAAGNSTASSGWLSFRPFQSIGTVAGIQNITSTVQNYLEAVAAGLQGGADLILNFISMLEQRVREIQELIQSIDSYLKIPLSIEIPDAVGLALVASGMDGVVSGFLSAGNKPTDGPDAYSGGLVVLGGGVPALITDIILTTIA